MVRSDVQIERDTEHALSRRVELDEFTSAATAAFDVTFDGESEFHPWKSLRPHLDDLDWQVGYIVGQSGTGKSVLLRDFGDVDAHKRITWDADRAIVSQIADDPDEAFDRLTGVGLNTIPTWLRPFDVCSTGEKFRAKLSRELVNGAVVDEFTSNVDRAVAFAIAVGVRRHIDRQGLKRIVFAAPHYDVIEALQPDWVFDTRTGVLSRGRLKRPPISVSIYPAKRSVWAMFAPHHYLTARIHNAARCFLAFWDVPQYDEWGDRQSFRQVVVGFTSAIHFPHPRIQPGRGGWREHRTVILPDYQGLGIGPRLSEWLGGYMIKVTGKRFFSRTGHPRFALSRDKSPLWKLLHKGVKKESARPGGGKGLFPFMQGWRASHEFIGEEIGVPPTSMS